MQEANKIINIKQMLPNNPLKGTHKRLMSAAQCPHRTESMDYLTVLFFLLYIRKLMG